MSALALATLAPSPAASTSPAAVPPADVSTGATILDTLEAEFADLGDAAGITRAVVRLSLAVLLAAVLGWNRERYGNAAGLRTHMLVGLGSALFVLAPLLSGVPVADMSRVLQGVIAGIGFLGAGAILKIGDAKKVRGVTTAASIFMTAAIGVTAGMGREVLAILCTLLALAILALLPRLERASRRGAAVKARRRPPSPRTADRS